MKVSEAILYPHIKSERGMTLIEVLVVAAIVAILGGITGIFLIKYLPEYHLRAAANNLTQDMKFAQVNALKTITTWSVTFTGGTVQTYSIIDSGGNNVKTVNLKSYPYEIRFKTIPGSNIEFNAEGYKVGTGNATVELKNQVGAVIKTEITRTGSIRVTR